ncbi:hypothetical protein B591_11586 [Streptomyces sp. GBA 94-10 4N24]|nr:hypothetical protein B591_11586 [Streptomyces sp. GBA 94-10 4N24]UZN59304.1 hypothetical protein B591N_11586 [Streptomyces sp. GBA 94-10 4N24]
MGRWWAPGRRGVDDRGGGRAEAEQAVEVAAEQGQRLALVGEGVGGGAARVGGAGRRQGGGQVARGRQVGGLGEQAGHRAVRDQ